MKTLARSLLGCALSILFFSSQGQTPEYPRIVEHRYNSPSLPGISPQLDINYELSNESRESYDEYVEEHESLKQEFDNERTRLEGQYQSASGESRINRARELIRLVIEYQAKFDSLEWSNLHQFSGDYEMSLQSNTSFFQINSVTQGTGDVLLSNEASNNLRGGQKISGVIRGQQNYSVRMADLINVNGSGTISDTLSGYYLLDWIYVKQKSFVTEGLATITGGIPRAMILEGEFTIVNNETSGDFVFALPGMVAMMELSPDQVTGDAYLFDDEMNFYHVVSTNTPVEKEEIFFYYTMNLITPELEEINFQEFIDEYFGWYVNAIHSERTHQFVNSNDLNQKAGTGKRTVEKLLDAIALADMIGVSPGIEDQLNLILNRTNSLFDIWYERYFSSKDQSIVQRLGSGDNEATHKERIDNAIRAVTEANIVASDELIQSLGLFEKSDFFSIIINDYFEAVHTQKCALGPGVYSQWKNDVRFLAQVFAQSYVLVNISNSNC